MYAKSLIATAGNYIGREYFGEEEIFPTTFADMVAQDEAEDLEYIEMTDDDFGPIEVEETE